ncbi:MbnP family protein [Membranihabitans marinus]|uniref:MbnP family protein n=1 Tax=Membranihabitans marinus TaxID=1227546 RepID=UPI001F389350|nr:MbnP family protein [Membranihabitans marinus]
MIRGILSLFVILLLASCSKDSKDELGSLNILFNLKYDGSTVNSPQDWYSLSDSVDLRFSKVSFYLSDITLANDVEDLVITDIIHLSYLQTILGDVINSNQIILPFSNLPLEQYSGLRFGLGVSPSLNRTSPTDYGSGQPLSYTSEYWTPWQSYIFAKIEGEFKVNGGESESFVLHTGSDEAYRTISIDQTLIMETDKEKNIALDIDLYKILVDYPIISQPRIHQLSQQEYVNKLSDNFANSLK